MKLVSESANSLKQITNVGDILVAESTLIACISRVGYKYARKTNSVKQKNKKISIFGVASNRWSYQDDKIRIKSPQAIRKVRNRNIPAEYAHF